MKQDHEWYKDFKKINWSIQKIDMSTMLRVKKMIKEVFNRDVVRCFKVIKRNPRVFRIELDDGTVMRFETVSRKLLPLIKLQEVAYLHHDGTPKVLFYKKVGRKFYKFSEWIDGQLVMAVQHLDKVQIKIGEMMAKLNNIKDPVTGLYITNSEINNTNLIWTKDEKIFSIDQDTLRALSQKGLDLIIFKNIVKRTKYKDRADMFLKGYSRYRDTSGILKVGNARNWTFGKKSMKRTFKGKI